MIVYRRAMNNIINTGNKNLNLFTLTRFFKGAKITKIKPAKLLIKKRGYLTILVQKLFIIKN